MFFFVDTALSTAYHPQTDGLSERKNQWVEQYLQFVTSASQDDWSNWLTIAMAVHNNYPNTTTRIAPIEALLGYSPRITMELPYLSTTVQLINDRTRKATEKRKQAKEALNEAARVTPPDSYQVGDRVWLKAKHLALPYQMPKLAPKRHGPFKIVKKVSPVAYQLKLPTAWTIHDIFHASLLTPIVKPQSTGPTTRGHHLTLLKTPRNMRSRPSSITNTLDVNDNSNTSSNGKGIPMWTTHGNQQTTYMPPCLSKPIIGKTCYCPQNKIKEVERNAKSPSVPSSLISNNTSTPQQHVLHYHRHPRTRQVRCLHHHPCRSSHRPSPSHTNPRDPYYPHRTAHLPASPHHRPQF